MGQIDLSPIRQGRHVTIRPLHPNDYMPLFQIAAFTDAGTRWRLRGETPTHERFMQVLLENAKVTFAIERNSDRQLLGMVQLWMYDAQNRHGHITTFLEPHARGRGWPIEGIILFVDHVFKTFDLHKLYFESLSDEYEQYGSMVGPILRPEGILRDHTWVVGRWVDYHLMALYAEDVPKLTRLLKTSDK